MTDEHGQGLERAYPVRLEIDYPEDGLNRVTTAFRLVLAIPIIAVAALLTTSAINWTAEDVSPGSDAWAVLFAAGGFVFLPALLMILFRQKYPRWWFDWNQELMRFSVRVSAYLALLRDEYPSTDEQQAIHLDIDYPDARRDLNRWLPLVKWLLAIPHYVALALLGLIAVMLVVITWFVILFTGRCPRGIFGFQVGVLRWWVRVYSYTVLLTTDRYPPFSLDR